MADPISRVLRAFPSGFFRSLAEYADAAFAEAWTHAKRVAEEPERANLLGQLRHARCEAGFRQAAKEQGLSVFAPHTDPAGGRYSLVRGEDLHLIRSNIQAHCGTPRPSKFRQQWSQVNAWLSPVQADLLRPTQVPSSDQLCGIIVITAKPNRAYRGDGMEDRGLSVPAFVGLGIPRADLSGWISLLGLNELLALYHVADSTARQPREAPVELRDQAIPRLKRRPGHNE